MADEPKPRAAFKGWQPVQLAVLAVVCLAAGLLAGYWLRGSAPKPAQVAPARAEATLFSAVDGRARRPVTNPCDASRSAETGRHSSGKAI